MSTKQLASLMIKISANGAQAQKELSTLETKVKDFGKSMQSIGASMTKYVTVPLTALAGLSVKAANTQLQAEARLLTALKNRQDVQQRLIAQAQEIQSRTTYGDEAIIGQQAYLAALGLTEEQIRDTIEASVQLSAALGIELESAVRNLAKTYSGMTGELGESMPALKALTEEQLKSGEAIRLVNQEYKGFAETAASTGAGAMEQLKNKVGDAAEKLGTALLPIIEKLVDMLAKLLDWFNSLSPETQELIAHVVALGAAFGPMLSAIGSLITLLPQLKAALASVSPTLAGFVAAIASIGLNVLMTDYDNGTSARLEAEEKARKAKLKAIEDEANRKTEDELKEWAYNKYKSYEYSELRKLSNTTFRSPGGWAEIPDEIWDEIERDTGTFYHESIRKGRTSQYAGYRSKIYEGFNKAFFEVKNGGAAATTAATESLGLIEQVTTRIAELEAQRPFMKTTEELAAANDELAELNKKLEYYYSLSKEGTAGTIEQASLINTSPISWGVSGVKDLGIIDMLSSYDADKWREQMIAKAQKMADVVSEMNSIISAALANMVSGIGNYLEALISGDEFKPLVALLSMIGETLKQLGSALVAYAVSLEAFKRAFSNPWAALAAGAAAIVAGSAVMGWAKRMEKTTKLATGGLAYGPTMAIVGDNPGASNDPEVIAPLSKLRDYMGAQRLQLIGDVTFEIAGDTMRAVLNRENVRLSTLG